jgi:hypothetical protein
MLEGVAHFYVRGCYIFVIHLKCKESDCCTLGVQLSLFEMQIAFSF